VGRCAVSAYYNCGTHRFAGHHCRPVINRTICSNRRGDGPCTTAVQELSGRVPNRRRPAICTPTAASRRPLTITGVAVTWGACAGVEGHDNCPSRGQRQLLTHGYLTTLRDGLIRGERLMNRQGPWDGSGGSVPPGVVCETGRARRLLNRYRPRVVRRPLSCNWVRLPSPLIESSIVTSDTHRRRPSRSNA
jgi:hypothetical protein